MRPFSFLILCISFFSLQSLAMKRLVFLGDSLTEGYGIAREQAFPALLEKKIKIKNQDWQVVNAGISGSTTASAFARAKWLLKSPPDLLLLALGANDGLRGLSIHEIEKNLSETIELFQQKKVKVILVGMQMPPNYTNQYAKQFAEAYPRLAKKYKIELIPFLLEGVAGDSKLNQSDGIHPNEKGHEIIAEMILKKIEKFL